MFFFFNDTATTEIYTLSLHDALPILVCVLPGHESEVDEFHCDRELVQVAGQRSEEHTSELQSPCNLVCRLLLEKKKCHASAHTFTIDKGRYAGANARRTGCLHCTLAG